VPAVHGDGRRFGLPGNAVTELADALTGPLLLPRDAEYATARRVWNGMIDRQPALIARCAGAADIRAAVQFAASHDLLVSVRGGGHSISGKAVCDGGLMIDLSGMRAIAVNADGQRALAQPGILLGELDRATVPQGLRQPGGGGSHHGQRRRTPGQRGGESGAAMGPARRRR
jgi:FAD/FMN-containing dehydrogenase